MKYNDTKTYTKLKSRTASNFPEMIICHHSGGTDANPLADTSHHTAEMMESWHLSKGWDGLGYTYVVHKDGAIWRGRPEHVSGAHTVNYNSKSIGIVLAGNFDATYPTKEQEHAFMELYKDIITRHPHLTPYTIRYHRDFAKKTCPGNNIKPDYFKNLAIKATTVEPEIKDDTKEALEFCKKENEKYKSFFQRLLDLINLFK